MNFRISVDSFLTSVGILYLASTLPMFLVMTRKGVTFVSLSFSLSPSSSCRALMACCAFIWLAPQLLFLCASRRSGHVEGRRPRVSAATQANPCLTVGNVLDIIANRDDVLVLLFLVYFERA